MLLCWSLLQFHIDHRVLLTGTPVQNNLRELYALLSFVAPHIFLDRYTNEFVERYSEVTDSSGTSQHKLWAPIHLVSPTYKAKYACVYRRTQLHVTVY